MPANDKKANNLNELNQEIGLFEKISYGVGDISNGLAVSSIGIWLLIYLTDVAGLKAHYAGLAIVIGRVWDACTDPLMGWITDNTKSRWGKRRPYLLFGAIPYAIAFFALWAVPKFDNQVYLFAYVAISLVIFNTFLTVVFVPYTSLTAAITNDYTQRTSLTGYRMTFSQIAFLFGAVAPSAFIAWTLKPNSQILLNKIGINYILGSWANSTRGGYLMMGGIFSIAIVASILICFLGTKEKDLTIENEIEKKENTTPISYASNIYDELTANHPYQSSVLILLFTNCAATFLAVLLPYYFQYALGIEKFSQIELLGVKINTQSSIFLALFLTAIFTVPFWVIKAKKYGKAETYKVAMLLYSITLISLCFIKQGSLLSIYAIAISCGFFHSAALTLPWAMIPDVVEHDQLKTGKRREGLFYGGTTLAYKLATALPVFLTSTILNQIGYIPNQAQSEQVVRGIRILIAFAPCLLLLIGAYVANRHPITPKRHQRIIRELKRRGLI